MKLSADKLIFPNFLYFLTNFEMYKRFSDRCNFLYSKFSCLKKVNTAASKFYVFNCKSSYLKKANTAVSRFYLFNCLKISAFDKS